MNDYDNIVFLSADIGGINEGPRRTEEALCCQKWAKGGVGQSTNPEKERLRWWMVRGTTRSCSGEQIGDAK